MNQCACKDCVCVPVCRHKGYFTISDCKLLRPMFKTIYDTEGHKAPFLVQKLLIIESLKPTTWSIDENGWIADGSRLV